MNLRLVSEFFTPERILDIGANIGQFHQLAKQTFPSAHIHSVEANPDCKSFLESLNFDHTIAMLGKDNSTHRFYVNRTNSVSTGNSMYRELTDHFRDDNLVVIEMECKKLDDLFSDTSFDLIKLDTQGSELDILSGGENIMKAARGIILEIALKPYNQDAPLVDEVLFFMESRGFEPVKILEEHIIDGEVKQIDYLFMRKGDYLIDLKYTHSSDRTNVLEYLKSKKFPRVLDIGATMNGWSSEWLSHYADITKWEGASIQGFIGNICDYDAWLPILEDVEKNGKFDFVICSHVLEDISSPLLVSKMISKIGKEGFIAVPSKNYELMKGINGPYSGWIHHRWIYNIENGKFVAYPKLNFIDYEDWSEVFRKFEGMDVNEISFFWKDSFTIHFANGDFMGPDIESVHRYFQKLKS